MKYQVDGDMRGYRDVASTIVGLRVPPGLLALSEAGTDAAIVVALSLEAEPTPPSSGELLIQPSKSAAPNISKHHAYVETPPPSRPKTI